MTKEQEKIIKNNEIVVEALTCYLFKEDRKHSTEEVEELLQKVIVQMEQLKVLYSIKGGKENEKN